MYIRYFRQKFSQRRLQRFKHFISLVKKKRRILSYFYDQYFLIDQKLRTKCYFLKVDSNCNFKSGGSNQSHRQKGGRGSIVVCVLARMVTVASFLFLYTVFRIKRLWNFYFMNILCMHNVQNQAILRLYAQEYLFKYVEMVTRNVPFIEIFSFGGKVSRIIHIPLK